MPLGPYETWDECIADNQDKADPEAYCGSLEQSGSRMAGMWIVADLAYDSDTEAREAERLAREGKVAGVSIDYALKSYEVEILETDEDGFPTDWLEVATEAEILGATQLPMPAFADARVEFGENGPLVYLAAEGVPTSDKRIFTLGSFSWRDPAPFMFIDKTTPGHEEAVFVGNLTNFRRADQMALVAAANPGLSGLTRPRVEGGKLIGHGAGWGTCHLNFPNACITPPSCDYSHCTNGVKVWRHPRGDIHAPLLASFGMAETDRWYETHCELVGVCGVGEDEHGVWVAGDTTLEDGEYYLSGDWRMVDGQLELNSFLVVENPAFPLALVASESQHALVAAGIVTESDDLVDRITRLEKIVEDYRAEKQAQLLASSFELTIEEKASLLDFA